MSTGFPADILPFTSFRKGSKVFNEKKSKRLKPRSKQKINIVKSVWNKSKEKSEEKNKKNHNAT
jgi:hypothetical protein